MPLLRRHWGFLLVLALAGPAYLAFCASGVVSSVGDDSASYLLVARYLAGDRSALLLPWVGHHTHFPPVFPLLLAASGSAGDLAAAHALVAATAAAAAALVYAYGARLGGRAAAGLLLAAVFLCTPTAWVSARGILSEPLYLAVSLLALLFHATRLERRDGSAADWLAFGLLLAAAYLTRAAGVALLAAYAVHALVRHRESPRRLAAALAPLGVAVVPVAAWMLLRPDAPGGGYAHTSRAVLEAWLANPVTMLEVGLASLTAGWVQSFTAEGEVGTSVRAAVLVAGALGLAAAIARAARNHLDGWYVLATLSLLAVWVFAEENMRRLLYPVVPVMLAQAGWLVAAGARRAAYAHRASAAVTMAAALLVAVTLPAIALVARKAGDREPFLAGLPHAPADITDYYRIRNVERARAMAAKHAAVLGGLSLLERATPPEARIMWARPEYVALLGRRHGVPLVYAWDERELAEAVRREGVEFIVASALAKTDLAHRPGDALAVATRAAPYSRAVLVVPNAVTGGEEFVLLAVDRERLAAFLGS